ncbi:MAG: polysaccharide lyase [Chitinophagaceae bacterium]
MFLSLVAATTLLVSCSKSGSELALPNEQGNVTDTVPGVQSAIKADASATGNLLYREDFETKTPFSTYVQKQIGTTYGLTVVASPVFQGKQAGRFELRDTDPITSGGTRSEVKFPDLTNPNRWYAFSVYFPESDYKYDSKAEIINQWHQGGGASPSISLITRYDKLVIEVRNKPDKKVQYPLGTGTIQKNKWRNYVLHIVHSNKSDGLIEVWEDGVKIFTNKGANSYDFGKYDKPKWKLGLYKWDWNGNETTDTKKRVVFFDDVRLGNEKATYAEMTAK